MERTHSSKVLPLHEWLAIVSIVCVMGASILAVWVSGTSSPLFEEVREEQVGGAKGPRTKRQRAKGSKEKEKRTNDDNDPKDNKDLNDLNDISP